MTTRRIISALIILTITMLSGSLLAQSDVFGNPDTVTFLYLNFLSMSAIR